MVKKISAITFWTIGLVIAIAGAIIITAPTLILTGIFSFFGIIGSGIILFLSLTVGLYIAGRIVVWAVKRFGK